MSNINDSEPVFLDVDPDSKTIQNETICMNCSGQGLTTIVTAKIQHFRNLQISLFKCPNCEYNHSSIKFIGETPAKGVRFALHINSPNDLQRRIVKSRYCSISIPSINLEIPGQTQCDSVSTVQGLLQKAYSSLQTVDEKSTIEEFLEKLNNSIKGLTEFDMIVDDPSGNSFIESLNPTDKDANLQTTLYERTEEQNEAIGLSSKSKIDNITLDDDDDSLDHIDSVFAHDAKVTTFPAHCSCCESEGTMRSCTLIIPHFKEIVILTFGCDKCGYRKAEVIVCGAISPNGRSISLHCDSKEDIKREILKSETAGIIIPECDFEMMEGSIAGKFTTIEGLLTDIIKNLKENNPYTNDRSDFSDLTIYNHLINTLDKYRKTEQPFTIILNDALSNSYIQQLGENDKLEITDYERSEEDNDMLGLNDMKTEEYIINNHAIYSAPNYVQQEIKIPENKVEKSEK